MKAIFDIRLELIADVMQTQHDICIVKESAERLEDRIKGVADKDDALGTELAKTHAQLKKHLQEAERLAARMYTKAAQPQRTQK